MTPLAASMPSLPLDLASLLPSGWRRPAAESVESATRRTRAPRAARADRIGAVEHDHAAGEPSDESLMLDFLDGRRDAFEALVRRYRVELHQFLFRFLNSTSAADDVFQEAFIQVFQSGHTFDPSRRFRPWLFTIAANKARDWHRRHRSRSMLSLDAPVGSAGADIPFVDLLSGNTESPTAPSERSEDATIVKALVDELPESLREIILLAYFQRLSYGQIAEALEIPLGTVKSRLHSAVATFAERWHARAESSSRATPPSPASGTDA